MPRPPHPRRGPELRSIPQQQPRPVIDPSALLELRELVAGLTARVGERRNDTQALARTLASQGRRLEELTALQSDALRRLAEADLRQRSTWRSRLAVRAAAIRDAARRRLAAIRLRREVMAAAEPEPVGRPPAWILADAKPGGIDRVVMVILFGLTTEQQQVIVARLLDDQLPPGVAPVFVTDRTEFEHFRSRRAFFERLPLRPREAAAGARDHELYAARRFTLLCDKWKPLRVVAFGPVAAGQLETWRASPHVAPPVRELLSEPDQP